MKDNNGFYSYSPSYYGANNDTYKGVPCKISISKKSESEYLICIDKIISEHLVFYKKSNTSFKIEDEGNVFVVYFDESGELGSKYILSTTRNGYPISLTYYPDKQNKDISIKYLNPLFQLTNWDTFTLFFRDNDKLSTTEFEELDNYCNEIIRQSNDFETTEFFNVIQGFLKHYQKTDYIKELNNPIIIDKALDELDIYLVTCITDLSPLRTEIIEQLTDGGIIGGSGLKEAFIRTKRQLNYLIAFKLVLHSLLSNIQNGIVEENNQNTREIYAEINQSKNEINQQNKEINPLKNDVNRNTFRSNSFRNETKEQNKSSTFSYGVLITIVIFLIVIIYFLFR